VTHSREHRVLNERLDAMGYPTKRVDRHVRQLLWTVDKVLPRKAALAATAALEHYTATFAETLLSDPKAQAMLGDSQVRPMLLWHALEEAEHKSVAFDVYRSSGGSEPMRIAIMEVASAIFWTEVLVQTTRSLLRDRATYNPVTLLRSLNFVRSQPFFGLAAIRRYNSYNRPGFHPDDWEASALIERWNAELFPPDSENLRAAREA
jgi:predicted metal-dependent hydrolase